MTRRVIVVALATAVLALASAAAAPRAEAVSFVDKQVQAGALLIQNYINTYGQAHRFVYPPKSMVKKGGGLPNATVIWPSNPWTGRIMAPGTSRGTYTYTLGAGNLSYRLTVHLSSGNYVLKSAMPSWFKTERNQAARQNLLLLQRYVEAYAAAARRFVPGRGPGDVRRLRRELRLARQPVDRRGDGRRRRAGQLQLHRRRRELRAEGDAHQRLERLVRPAAGDGPADDAAGRLIGS